MLGNQLLSLLVKMRRYLTRNTLLLLAASTVGVVLLGGVLVYAAERHYNPSLATVADAVWYAIVTITTVGYGDSAPITNAGRIVGVGLMVFGIGFLGLFTATVASLFIDRLLREGKGLMPVRAEKHIIICGWSDKGRLILQELRSETERPIVILADLPERPLEAPGVTFVRGRPYTEESLRRADIANASAAIVLADEAEGVPSDARTVLTVLAVESINGGVYTCAEVLDRENVEHLQRAGADEILPTTSLVGSLLARATLHPGVIQAVSELSTSSAGAELYVVPAPTYVHGVPFDQAMARLRERAGAILIGVRQGDSTVLCPPGEELIAPGQQLFVVALEPPKL
jgi:voltage-gated potassium channel